MKNKFLKVIYSIIFLVLLLSVNNVHSQSTSQDSTIDIEIESNNAIIKGSLYIPNKDMQLPLIIVIPGSGKIERKDLGMIKSIFSGLEIATFIYDKRGVGESTGTYIAANAANSKEIFSQRSKDVQEIVKMLKSNEHINANQIGLMGSSQGGWIISMVASESNNIAFTICISGAASSVGISDYYDSIAEEADSIELAIAQLNEFKGENGFNPYNSIKNISSPALWIYGGQDKSNPTIEDIRILNEIRKIYNKEFYIHLYPTYNHDLIDLSTGELGEKVIPELRQWVMKILKI